MSLKIQVQRYKRSETPRATAQVLGRDGKYEAILIKHRRNSGWAFWIKGSMYKAATLREAIAQWRLLA